MSRHANDMTARLTFVATIFLALVGTISLFNWLTALTDFPISFEAQMVRFYHEAAVGKHPGLDGKDFIVLGDSTSARAFPQGSLGEFDFLNLSVFGGSIYDSELLLQRLLERTKSTGCLVIQTSYGAATTHYKKRYWQSIISNRMHTLLELNEFYRASESLGDYPATKMTRIQFLWRALLEMYGPSIGSAFLQDNLFTPSNITAAKVAYQEVVKNRGGLIFLRSYRLPIMHSFLNEFQEFYFKPFKVEPMVDQAFLKLIQTAKEIGAHVLVIQPPLAEALRTEETRPYLEGLHTHLKVLIQNFDNVTHLTSPSELPDGLFYDASHLYSDGANAYIETILPAIRSCVGQKRE